jgi:hypothetical protein
MYNANFVVVISLNPDLCTCLYHPVSGSASCSCRMSYCNERRYVIVYH